MHRAALPAWIRGVAEGGPGIPLYFSRGVLGIPRHGKCGETSPPVCLGLILILPGCYCELGLAKPCKF